MTSYRSHFTEHDEKLPIEYSLREAVIIYFKRLMVFFIAAATNILVFLLFVGIQYMSAELVYWLNVNLTVGLLLGFTCFVLISSLAYQRSNPVRGYLTLSDETNKVTINLYTGWRITKRKLDKLDVPPHWPIQALFARNTQNRRHRSPDEQREIELRFSYKYHYGLYRDHSYKVVIREGETIRVPEGIMVSYGK